MRSWSRSTSFRTGKGVTRTRLLRARLLSAAALSQGSVPGLENTKTCFSARSIMDERERERETTLRNGCRIDTVKKTRELFVFEWMDVCFLKIF